jgi:hypothetical protein
MTTKAIEDREAAELPTTYNPDEPGLAGRDDESDILTPACSIVQPTSESERGEQGTYWWSSGINAKTFDAVTLQINFTRTLWAPKSTGANAPICRSPDREIGMTTEPSLVLGKEPAEAQGMVDGDMAYIPCDHCSHFKDEPWSGGDWLCTKGSTLLLFNKEQGPFVFYIKGTAVSPVKRAIISPALLRRKQELPINLCGTLWTWGLALTENDKGKFYVPTVTASRMLDLAETAEHEAMASEMRGRVSQQMATAAEEEGQQEPA